MTARWEPPEGVSRAAGGLLGVVGGETWHPRGGVSRVGRCGPIAAAMLDLSYGYLNHASDGPPTDIAERHDGAPAPAWLLSAAIVRPHVAGLVSDTLELAAARGVPRSLLSSCVVYAELAACLFAGWPTTDAIVAATGQSAPRLTAAPTLCGDTVIDAVSVAIWALNTPGDVASIVQRLGRVTTPGVIAGVAGLLGLRDGADSIPRLSHRRLRPLVDGVALAEALTRLRHGPTIQRAGYP